MKRFKNYIFDSQLLSGSLVMIISSVLVNFGNYIYHVLMGRMLEPTSYGALISLITIFYFLAIPSLALGTVVMKFTTIYKAKNDYQKLFSLFRLLSEKIVLLGIVVILFFIFASGLITEFLNISESGAVVLVGSFFLFSLLTTVNNGILQGLLSFNFLSANNIFSTILKVGFAILLVKMGFGVNGAVAAVLVSYIFPYIASLYPIRFLWKHNSLGIKIERKEIIDYTFPATLAILGMTSLYSIDIILVKHFFPSYDAGLYGAISVIGKIIFFASSTISIVMFPIISEKFESGAKYRVILYQALLLVTASSVVLTIIYFLRPNLMIKLLYGSSYLTAAPYLGLFAVFISIYSLSNLIMQFFLSIRATKASLLAVCAAILQGVLIWLFHNDIKQVITSSIIASSLLLASLLIYYFRISKNPEVKN